MTLSQLGLAGCVATVLHDAVMNPAEGKAFKGGIGVFDLDFCEVLN